MMKRRNFLKSVGFGALGLPLAGSAFYNSAQGAAPLAKQKKKLGKAKSVIQIWMWGGPSQLETFDPKPAAGKEIIGPRDKILKTNARGIPEVSDAIPELAQCADMYAVLPSVTHGDNNHETAAYKMQTGYAPGGNLVYPALGAIVSNMKGYRAGYDSVIPPYIVLTQPQGRFSECGYLGTAYKPYATGGDPNRDPFLASGFVLAGVDDERKEKRLSLLDATDLYGNVVKENSFITSLEDARKEAYGVLTGDEVKLFDLTTETDEVRKAYGRTTFGQSCLMARRLVEYGVPYITINYGGWDTHSKHFETVTRKQPEMDKAMAFLFKDLRDRGLLDTTIIWWGGEFGRTPRIDYNAPWFGGRHHFGACFTHMVGGGGLKSGVIVGKSDSTASTVVERPVEPQDLLGTICMQLGIDPEAEMPNSKGFHDLLIMKDQKNPSKEGYVTELLG